MVIQNEINKIDIYVVKTQGFDIILPKVKLATRDPLMVFIFKGQNSPLYLLHFKKYMYLKN